MGSQQPPSLCLLSALTPVKVLAQAVVRGDAVGCAGSGRNVRAFPVSYPRPHPGLAPQDPATGPCERVELSVQESSSGSPVVL